MMLMDCHFLFGSSLSITPNMFFLYSQNGETVVVQMGEQCNMSSTTSSVNTTAKPNNTTGSGSQDTGNETGLLSPQFCGQHSHHYSHHYRIFFKCCWLQLKVKPMHCLTWPATCPNSTPVRWISWFLNWRVFCQAQMSAWHWETPPSALSAICWVLLQRH